MSAKSLLAAGLVLGMLLSLVAVGGLVLRPAAANLDSLGITTPVEGQIVCAGVVWNAGISTALDHPLRPGDHVRKGQLLATLRSCEVCEIKSRYVAATASLLFEKDALQRMEQLGANAALIAVAAKRVELETASLKRAETALRALPLGEAEIAALRSAATELHRTNSDHRRAANWADLQVVAPEDGVVVRVAASAGQTVQPGTVLFEITHDQRAASVAGQLPPLDQRASLVSP